MVKKNKKKIFFKAILFLLLLWIIIPGFMTFFISFSNFENQIRTVFLLQKLNKLVGIAFIIFIVTSFEKLCKEKESKVRLFQTIIFLMLSISFFSISFWTQGDINKVLSEGIKITDSVNFDGERWLAPNLLSDKDKIKGSFVGINRDDDFLRKIIPLKNVPEKAVIGWYGFWSGESEDCKVFVIVNEESFDVSRALKEPDKVSRLSFQLPKNPLKKGINQIILSKQGGCSISIATDITYSDRRSYYYDEGRFIAEPFMEYEIFIDENNSGLFKTAFKLSFILRVLGIIFLFLSIYGFKNSKRMFSNAWKELIFSTLFAYILYYAASIVEKYWFYLSKTVTYAVYFLAKISFLNPIMDVSNISMPSIGAKNFVLVLVDSCSGIDGIAYFFIAYTALLVFNWRRINLKKALIAYIPGLIGVFLVNIVRVYLILIIGIFISEDFAVNSFHTNAGVFLFIIYFLIFWPLISKRIKN